MNALAVWALLTVIGTGLMGIPFLNWMDRRYKNFNRRRTMTHEKLIRDTVAALVTEYGEKRPRMPLADYVEYKVAELIGALDEAEQALVDVMVAEASKPQGGKVWRED